MINSGKGITITVTFNGKPYTESNLYSSHLLLVKNTVKMIRKHVPGKMRDHDMEKR